MTNNDREKNKAEDIRAQIMALVGEYAKITLAKKPFAPGLSAIPPSGKVLDERDISNLVEASLDGWLTAGRFANEFETRLAVKTGAKRALACNSGSSANLLAVSSLFSPSLGARALVPGDEIITAAAGFPTTINPIIQNGAIPVFVDSALPSCNIDVSKIEAAIGPRTKAIIVAHTLGNPYDLRAIREIATRRNLWMIEDCCDALGARWEGQNVGTFGDIGTLSFYPAHHITMGEGGAVFTSNPKLAKIMESFRDWGRDCFCNPGKDNTCGKRFCRQMGGLPYGYDHKYTYSHIGYNLKITDMQAAIGLSQLDKADSFIEGRIRNHSLMVEALAGTEEFLILPRADDRAEPSWFGCLLTLTDKARQTVDRNTLVAYLEERKIGTRLLFAGNYTKQPAMEGKPMRISGNLDVADKIMNDSFWVGIYPGLEEAQIRYCAKSIREFFVLD